MQVVRMLHAMALPRRDTHRQRPKRPQVYMKYIFCPLALCLFVSFLSVSADAQATSPDVPSAPTARIRRRGRRLGVQAGPGHSHSNEQQQQQQQQQQQEEEGGEQGAGSRPSIDNVIVGVVEIEQPLNDTILPTIHRPRNSRRRRRSSSSSSASSQRAVSTESHPFFDGTLEALIREAKSTESNNSNTSNDDSLVASTMDRLRVVDTSMRRTTRRGGRRPRRRVSGTAARSA